MTKKSKERLTKKDLWAVYRHQMLIRAGLNFERQQNSGFTAAMTPIIDKYYDDPKDKAEAMERHMQLFLTQPMVSAIPVGIAAAMEERIALQGDIDPESVNAVKSALMGPLAALGDSLINGTARPILAGIAISFAMQGNVVGPILFLVGMSIITLGVRYLGVFKGYERGVGIVDEIHKSGLISKLTELSSVAAYVVIGGFVPIVISMGLKISIANGDSVIDIQSTLDGLSKGILPLAMTMFMYWLISKKKANPVVLMLLIMVFGIACVYLGIM